MLKKLLVKIKKQNKKIIGYGASTKGNVLLQYCKIDSKILSFIAEVNKFKFGKYTPGTDIKIISEKMLCLKNQIICLFCLGILKIILLKENKVSKKWR